MERTIGHGASPRRRTVGGPSGAGRARALRALAVATAIAGAAAAHGARAQAKPDSWTGSDKALHAGVSAPLGAMGAALAPPGAGTAQRLLYGTALGALPGLAKELADLNRPGATPSMKDMAFNVLGAALGAAVADCCLIRPLASGDRIDGIGIEYRIGF
ncbi:MAG: hypothetical protein ACK50I_24835 [Burkholderiales bacterium]